VQQKTYPGRKTPFIEEKGPPDAVDLDSISGVGDKELGRKEGGQ
jgi:hypothetical protein